MGIYIVGDWRIDLDAGWLEPRRTLLRRRNYPDSRLIAVLRVLIERRGQLVSSEQILKEAWPDRVVSRDSVTTAIYELRQLLVDDAASPTYIRTEPRRGYRLIASLEERAVPPRTRMRQVAAVAVFGILIIATTSIGYIGQHGMSLQVEPLKDVTRDKQLAPLSDAIDATLRSALIRMNPGRVIISTEDRRASLRLQSEIVACDLGPALVVQLLDLSEGRYVWSRTYDLDHDGANPTLVELVASDVSEALPQS